MAEYDEALKDKLDMSAAEFSRSLEAMAGLCENRFGKIVRKTVLDLYGNIIKRSPVDTGTYKASHMIANHDPGPDEGVILLDKKGTEAHMAEALARTASDRWTWNPGDGVIYLFNNVPYAEPLENGHSGQAPEGIYLQALTEATSMLRKAKAQIDAEGIFK